MTITCRSEIGYEGLRAPVDYNKQFIQIETAVPGSAQIDYKLMLVTIPGCQFKKNVFDVEVTAWNAGYNTIVHTKAASKLALPSSISATGSNDARIIYEFSTHNELKPAFPYNLGFSGTSVRCNGWQIASETTGNPGFLNSAQTDGIKCMVVPADCSDPASNSVIPFDNSLACVNGGLSQTHPVYIIVYDFEAIAADDYVQIDFADILNKATSEQNDFAHIAIRWQIRDFAGSWIDQN